jgi:protein-S-isoprenylcysteine O-methyltransferase Ste14
VRTEQPLGSTGRTRILKPLTVLAIVFWLKSIREEVWLTERYPDYAAYRRETPRRFIPWLV